MCSISHAMPKEESGVQHGKIFLVGYIYFAIILNELRYIYLDFTIYRLDHLVSPWYNWIWRASNALINTETEHICNICIMCNNIYNSTHFFSNTTRWNVKYILFYFCTSSMPKHSFIPIIESHICIYEYICTMYNILLCIERKSSQPPQPRHLLHNQVNVNLVFAWSLCI